ncbi:MAG: cache domain-containing protein, partial [Oscillospiraceae bacterium]
MRIKLKLILVFLALLLIPVIIINIVSSNIINENCMRVYLESIERSMKNQAEDINYLCEDIVSSSKKFTVNPDIRSYTSEVSGSDFEEVSSNEHYDTVMRELERFKELDGTVVKAMLIDKSGIVIGSTESGEIGRRLSNYKEMFAAALVNNGFSAISMSGDNNMTSPVFTVSKSVYSEQNERIGILHVVYDTSNIQTFINSMKLDKYTNTAIMDGSGYILEYPYKNVRLYSGNGNYSEFSDEIKSIVTGSGASNGLLNIMTDKGSGSSKKIYYACAIQNAGWYIISYTDKAGLTNTVKQYSGSLELVSFMICIACIILVIVFATYFAKPVMEIIRVFTEKQKGNVGARFNVRSHDEFREIGLAFNSMFDNIFESEQRYRTIVEMTNNIIFEINYKKGTVYTSKNFNKKFSFRPKDDTLQESFIYKLRIHKDDKDRYMADWDRILGNANFIQGEYRVKSIYGDFIWIMIKATKFFDRDEVPTKVVGVIVDI